VRILTLDKTIEGIAIDVDNDGTLLLDTGKGIERVAAGDVIHLRAIERKPP